MAAGTGGGQGGGGRGGGTGRGGGAGPGRRGGPKGGGPDGTCICPNCGYKTRHNVDKPCSELIYPHCGAPMTRE
jgi:hypothetical protein